MAEYSPPTDNVPIFDVTNFAPSGSGLSEAQIASKFLRFPTGQGTETLPTLITNIISPTDDLNIIPPSNKNVTIFPDSLTSGKIDLMTGTSAVGSINMLTGVFSSGNIDMGGATTTTNINGQNINIANVNEYGDNINIMSGEYSYGITNINNNVGNYGVVNIMNFEQSDGIINIGNNSDADAFKTTTNIKGTINIETTPDSTSTLNIMNGVGNNGILSIGSSGTGISIEGVVDINANTPFTVNTIQTNIGATSGIYDTNTTISGKTTINKLATPLTPIYAYPVSGVDQIGYNVKVNIPANQAIPTALTNLIALPSLSSGQWLLSFLMMIKGGVTNNIGVNAILYKDTTALTYSVTWVGGTGISTSNNIVLVDNIAIGTNSVYSIKTTCNQTHATSPVFPTPPATPTIIDNAGYFQATRIA